VLLETEDDRLKLTATDLDTAIRCVIPAQIAQNGAVAVPAGVLTDVVSKLPDAPVSLEMQDGKVTVRSGKSDYTILSLPAEDFPVVPEVSEGTDLTLPQATLKEERRPTTSKGGSILSGSMCCTAAMTMPSARPNQARFLAHARTCESVPCSAMRELASMIPEVLIAGIHATYHGMWQATASRNTLAASQASSGTSAIFTPRWVSLSNSSGRAPITAEVIGCAATVPPRWWCRPIQGEAPDRSARLCGLATIHCLLQQVNRSTGRL
jgi:hypothetical protein